MLAICLNKSSEFVEVDEPSVTEFSNVGRLQVPVGSSDNISLILFEAVRKG